MRRDRKLVSEERRLGGIGNQIKVERQSGGTGDRLGGRGSRRDRKQVRRAVRKEQETGS
jgi:hypothetical protein